MERCTAFRSPSRTGRRRAGAGGGDARRAAARSRARAAGGGAVRSGGGARGGRLAGGGDRRLDGGNQRLLVEGLPQILRAGRAPRALARGGVVVRGDENDRDRSVRPGKPLLHFEAAEPGEVDVEDQAVEAVE